MSLLEIALDYQQRGLSVIPILPGTKRPPERFRLSRYFKRAATVRQIRRWFGNGASNIAVCLGDVSDGLTCRDFDREDAYDRWAENHPRLARTLPTARTARGRHVYFTTDSGDFGDRQIIPGADGELKRGGYTLVPASIHPTGARYEWLQPLDDAPFVSDLWRVGLWPEKGCGTQDILPPSAPSKDQNLSFNHSSIHSRSLPFNGLTIDQCIEVTQPTGYGERHYCLFSLVRMLKSTELKDAAQDELMPVFERWLQLARPRIRTKDWRTNWLDFLDGWGHVRCPYGATMTAVAERVRNMSCVPLASIHGLELVCRELQRIAGNGSFHLDCRTAAKVLGVGKSTAHRWLRQLCKGPMERTRKGDHDEQRASEYRFRDLKCGGAGMNSLVTNCRTAASRHVRPCHGFGPKTANGQPEAG